MERALHPQRTLDTNSSSFTNIMCDYRQDNPPCLGFPYLQSVWLNNLQNPSDIPWVRVFIWSSLVIMTALCVSLAVPFPFLQLIFDAQSEALLSLSPQTFREVVKVHIVGPFPDTSSIKGVISDGVKFQGLRRSCPGARGPYMPEKGVLLQGCSFLSILRTHV